MQQNYEYYPLTNPQKGIWYTEKLYPDTSIGIIAGTLRIKENVDFTILEKAINLFIKKNDSMRIRITEIEGKPYQYFRKYEHYHIDFIDFSGKDINEMYKWDTTQTKTPFKLLKSDLFYFAIIKVSEFDAGFYIKCHHLISDAWSISMLGSQVMAYYSNLKICNDISDANNPSYINFIKSEHSYLESERLIKDSNYWKEVFREYPGKTFLKNNVTENLSFKSRRKTMLTPIKLTAKINQFCSECNTSVFSLFMAALAMYINRVTDKEDIVLGTTTLNRSNMLEKSTVGMFNNINPIRININDDMDFTSLIRNVSSEGFKLLRHQKYPFDLVLKEIREKHKIDDGIFNIVLIYQNSKFLKDNIEEQYFTRWHFNGYQVDSLHISINDRENEGHLIIDYDYQTDVFQAKEIEFIHQNIINILWHALDNPCKKISNLEMLSEKEKHRILYEFNKTKIIVPQGLRETYMNCVKKIPEKLKSYILDKNHNLLPIGIIGELYFSKTNLSEIESAKINIDENDAIDNPYAPGELLYRSGIKARWFPDGDIMLIGDSKQYVTGENTEQADKKKTIRVNIMSTFTAEPIEDYLKWWGTKFRYITEVKFAKYNQVFQELLNPDSMMSGNVDGIDVALIRFEDFIRYETGTDAKKTIVLERTYNDFKEVIDRFDNNIPLIIAIFPASKSSGLSNSLQHKIEKINREFSDTISKYKNISMLDFDNLNILYNVEDTFDLLKDKEAHMPFTDEYYAAIGTEIARKILAIKKQKFKVIVLDCDNTLWKGICGEIGVLGVHVTEPYVKLQRFMLQKYNEGMLLAISSKNNIEDVIEVFSKNPEMVLNQNHIISWKVSWEEKSVAIREISQELGVGLDSFIFIDDDSLECLKMLENCPEVLTLQLPSNDNHIQSFLEHVWAFDKVCITTEDVLRNRMYQQENKRKALKSKGISLESFLMSLELKVSMRLVAEHEIARAAQLTQRTNQFNMSTIRRTEEEIALLIKDAGTACFVVEVSDKFGDYGIIGLIILKNMCDILLIDTFLMSCRIFGRNVEDIMLAGIGRYANEAGISVIEANFIPTKKNKAIYDFISRTKWRLVKNNKYHRYNINVSELPKGDDHIKFFYMDTYEKNEDNQIEPNNSLMVEYESGGLYNSRIIGERDIDFDTSLIVKNINHKEFIEPLRYSSGKKLLHIFDDTNSLCSCEAATYESEMQKRLLMIWESTLRVHNIGIDSDFFDLGGDSLHAVILISKIKKDFGVELTLRDVFQFSTIRKLEQKLDQSETSEYGRIIHAGKRQYYELSSAQKRMYILNKIETDQTVYNECYRINIEGKLSGLKLEAAFKEFIQRHEIMRTGFEIIDGKPVQRVYDSIDFTISYLKGREEDIDNIIGEFIKPFDLSKPLLIRVCLIETGIERFTLLIDMHHIIVDGASFGILIRELQALYGGRELEPPEFQYRDFANWQNELLNSPQIRKQEQYWLEQFNGEIPMLNMPTDHLRMPIQSFKGGRKYFAVGADIVNKLEILCADSGSTMFMLLFAAFNVLLHRYSGQEDIVVGIPVSGRKHVDTKGIAGMIVNTLPIRTYPKRDISFSTYLSKVKESILMGLENQDYQYEMLVDKLKVPRELNRNPMFDVLFSLQNTDMPELDIAGLTINLCNINNHKSKFDISILVTKKDSELDFCIEYCTDLFNDDYISRFQEHFTNILNDVSEDSLKCISDIEIISDKEKQSILNRLNDTDADYPRDMTIHQLFEIQSEKTPDRVAVVFENKEMTYGELNAKANLLARLLRDKGVKRDTIVAIKVERSLEMIIGMLAILKAGGAYLPIDPEYPQERVKYMLEDSGAKILLTQTGFPEVIEGITNILFIDDEKIYTGDSTNLINQNNSSDLIYMIYTSGSTGKPKGVMLEHRNITNFIKGVTDRININTDDVMLCITTMAFDIFVLETWLPLTRGIKTVISNKNEQFDIGLLADMVVANNITVLQMTPSRMRLVCEDLRSEKLFRCIKIIMLGGEPLPLALFESVKAKTTARIYNMYGPTETAVWSSIKDMTDETDVSIGKPINNTQFYILNESLHIQPFGIPGELYIAGDGLARGYFNKPDLTKQRFIDNSICKKGKIYQTGDLSVLSSSGDIKVIGRLDNQVKLGGHRIELEEIEKVILLYKGISECAVTIKQQSDASQFLCAFIISDSQILNSALTEFLKGKLPSYMIPKLFIRLSKFPLNNNKKVDRNVLNKINTEINVNINPTRTEGEVQLGLAEIFKKILNIKSISANQNFLNLGADSLQIIRLTIEIFNFFEVELRYGEILKSNTIQALSKLISDKLLNNYSNGVDIGTIYALLNEKKKENVFAFPPITGFGLAFNEMAKNMKGFSLYSFNYIEDENKIEQYYQAIKSIQESGPYVLLGFSAGADIVYELSKKFEEKTIIILMDGFWGEVSLGEIEKKVDFFIDYSMSYANLDKNNKFLTHILDQRIRSYMYYVLNKNKFTPKISNDIHFLYSEELSDQDIEKVNVLTNGKIYRYKAFGKHFELLQKGYVEKNTEILSNVINSIR